MFIARVVGNVWATRKHPSLEDCKLLLIKSMDGITAKLHGKIQMAVEKNLSAGPGDVVLVIDEGNSARQILNLKDAPIRTVIIGIIDTVRINQAEVKYT